MHEVTADILENLRKKHPEPKDISDGSAIQGPLPQKLSEEVIYEHIDAEAISKAARKVQGASGPSGADSDMWQRLLCSKQHKKKPAELCQAVADLAKKLNREAIPPSY